METFLIGSSAIVGGVVGSALGFHYTFPLLNPEEAESTKGWLRNLGLGIVADMY